MRVYTAILLLAGAAVTGDGSVKRPSNNALLWRDPGPVERLDLRYGPGGRALHPRAPFTFVAKESSGSTKKVRVRDAAGRAWVVKFGDEARPDTFCSRIAWAMGYFTEVNYFVPRGVIRGYGAFTGGRFQLRAISPQYLEGVTWAWDKNPFVGTPQLHGLKILMMLLSNWDSKDSRDVWRGANTSVYKDGRRYLYFVDDWGGSMGRAGNVFTRSKWDVVDYWKDTPKFLRGVRKGEVELDYHGAHTESLSDEIRVSDVRWLMRYLGRLTDGQIRTALLASGAGRDEAFFYTKAIRARIRQLDRVARR